MPSKITVMGASGLVTSGGSSSVLVLSGGAVIPAIVAAKAAAAATSEAQTAANAVAAAASAASAESAAAAAANIAPAIDTDGTLSANSDGKIASQKATKTYVDNAITGIKWKPSVLVATTTNVVLSGEQIIDGLLTSGSRVLVKNQTVAAENGIYLTAAGAWTRTVGGDSAAELTAATVTVEQGSTFANTAWTMTTDNVTLGTTALVWTRIFGAGQYSAGIGMLLSGNQFSVNSLLQSISGLLYAAGDLLYYNGTDLVNLARGTAGQVLTMDGAGVVPVWAAATGGGYITDISMLYLAVAANAGTRLNMVGGIADSFADQTDVNTAGSTNEVFTPGSYAPSHVVPVDQIPTMTGPTTSGVTITYSAAIDATRPGWKVSNGSLVGANNIWHTPAAGGVGWVAIDFGLATSLGSYTIQASDNSNQAPFLPKSFTLQGSNDGTNWVVVDTQTNLPAWATLELRTFSLGGVII